MNEIINWIALNNTLMIRIGFSAVIMLSLVYIFRFFFVPKPAAASGDAETASEAPAAQDKASETSVAMNAISQEEIARLNSEINSLKNKLKETQAQAAASAAAAMPVEANGSSGGMDVVAEEQLSEQGEAAGAAVKMQEKIKTLEARLQEYEIIAEDIAEISKLRQENEELKNKINSEFREKRESDEAGSDAQDVDFAVAETETPEKIAEQIKEQAAPAEEEFISEQAFEELLGEAASQIVITSEIPVNEDDKNVVDEFENFSKKAKGG